MSIVDKLKELGHTRVIARLDAEVLAEIEKEAESARATAIHGLKDLERSTSVLSPLDSELEAALELKASAVAALEAAQLKVVEAMRRRNAVLGERSARRTRAERVLRDTDPQEITEFLSELDATYQRLRGAAADNGSHVITDAIKAIHRLRPAAQALQGAPLSRKSVREELAKLAASINGMIDGKGFGKTIELHIGREMFEKVEPRRARAS